jgi:hypothetical protein
MGDGTFETQVHPVVANLGVSFHSQILYINLGPNETFRVLFFTFGEHVVQHHP